MIQLAPMTEADFQEYCAQAIEEYAQEHVRSGHWSAEEASQKAAQQYQELLPNGVATPNNYLFMVREESTQTMVGMLWYAIQTPKPVAFIYDVRIEPAFRRRGYATQAFQALEQQARAQGVSTIRLHVFGHNHEARALYEKLGYLPTNIMMNKSLD